MGLFDKFSAVNDILRFTKKIEEFSKIKTGEIMTKDVLTITPDETLIDAAHTMIGQHISSLVVVGEKYDVPIGIITERDFLIKAPHNTEKLKTMKVSDIMTKNLVTVQPSLPIIEVNEIMNEHKFRKVVVTDDKKLAGIITQTDLVEQIDNFYQKFPFASSDSLDVKSVQRPSVNVKTTETIDSVRDKMADKNTGTSFVFNKNSLVGIFTEFDFISELALQPEELNKLTVGESMTFPVFAVNGDVDVLDVNHLMIEKGSRRLPALLNQEVLGKITQRVVREKSYEIFKKSLERARNATLESVNFKKLKKAPVLVRKIQGKVQEYVYA